MDANGVNAPARPNWLMGSFDPARACPLYISLADGLVLWFGDRPMPSSVDWIDAPGSSDAAVLIGEGVGVQIDLLVVRASEYRPAWRVLAEPSPPPAAVAALVADVADLFERYWTPPPPIAEQVASLAPAAPEAGDDGDR